MNFIQHRRSYFADTTVSAIFVAVNFYKEKNMHVKNYFKTVALVCAFAAMFSSCSDDDNTGYVQYVDDFSELRTSLKYTPEGYWTSCYEQSSNAGFKTVLFHFSHSAIVTEWDGVSYYSWNGFTPSIASDQKDYTGEDWIEHQWSPMTPEQQATTNVNILANWDVQEENTPAQECKSLVITDVNGDVFTPGLISVTNTTYGYYAMKNGTAFSRRFTGDDWTKITAYGVYKDKVMSESEFYLAKDGNILDQFRLWDLSGLGEVEKVVFKMSSSDTGQYGMNNPAYFVIGAMAVVRQLN